MANWQIGESGTVVVLDNQGRGEVTFTVTNTSAQQDRAVLTITPLDGAADSWFAVEEPQRVVAPAASAVYHVAVTVPPGTAPSVYACQAIAYSADHDPSESSVSSKRVTIEVRAAAPRPTPFPWWIFLVIAAFVLIVALVLWRIVSGDGDDDETPTQPTPTAQSTTTVGPDGSNALEIATSWTYNSTPASVDQAEAECIAGVVIDVVGESRVEEAGGDLSVVFGGTSGDEDDLIRNNMPQCLDDASRAEMDAVGMWPWNWYEGQ